LKTVFSAFRKLFLSQSEAILFVAKHHDIFQRLNLNPPSSLHTAQIYFPSGAQANLGNELTPRQVKDSPNVTFPVDENKPDELYSLLVTDPDAPSRSNPEFAEWRHWHIVNIPQNQISKGKEFAQYIGSAPPPDTGLHRYIYMIFKQSSTIDVAEIPILSNRSQKGRAKFQTAKWISQQPAMTLHALNFYQAKYDNYVPEIYKQLD